MLSQIEKGFGIVLCGLFPALKSPFWRGLGDEKTSSQLLCLSREERSRGRKVQDGTVTVVRARPGFVVPRDAELQPSFCGD